MQCFLDSVHVLYLSVHTVRTYMYMYVHPYVGHGTYELRGLLLL